jgi:type IX secretion system PorP/SprF family membrane protein
MKRLIFSISMLLLGQMISAQQLPIYSQYLYNKFLINPAHAGSDGYTSYNITAREQWVGYSGAPRTYSLSWQTRILKSDYSIQKSRQNKNFFRPKSDGKVGLGAYIFSDKNGLVHRTGFQMTYSYHMWVKDQTQLSLGLAANGYYFTVDVDQGSFIDPNEPLLNNNLRRGVFVPNIDFGVYLLNPHYDLGLSAQQIIGSAVIIGDLGGREYRMYRHFYGFGSYNFQTGLKTVIQPSLLLKMSELDLIPQADIGATYIYDQHLWTGITYRTSGAIIANIMFRVIPPGLDRGAMFFGYAFDFTANKIQSVTYGTHEFTLALKFGDSSKRYRWLDRF